MPEPITVFTMVIVVRKKSIGIDGRCTGLDIFGRCGKDTPLALFITAQFVGVNVGVLVVLAQEQIRRIVLT